MCVRWSLNHVHLFVTSWTVALQAPLSIEFSKQEYWSGLPFPSPGGLPNPGIEPRSPALQADSLPAEPELVPRNLNLLNHIPWGQGRFFSPQGLKPFANFFFFALPQSMWDLSSSSQSRDQTHTLALEQSLKHWATVFSINTEPNLPLILKQFTKK